MSEEGLISQSAKSKSLNPTAVPLLSLAKVIVIKQGPNPVILLSRDALAQEPLEDSQTELEIPVPKLEKVTDTLAAGDTFAAGFLVAKTIQRQEWQEATTAAINAATDLLSKRS